MDLEPTKREKMVASGSYFERKVASTIATSIQCKILMNPEFYSNSLNRGTECDLIVISPVRIYCIECKNYKGFIAGDLYEPTWKFVSSGKLGHVQNPYLLNKRHIRLIRGTFYKRNLNPLYIENIIVVPNKCKIHVEGCNVLSLSELITKLVFEYEHYKPIYNVDTVEKYLNEVKL